MSAVRIALFLLSNSNDYQQLLEEDCQAAVRRRNASLQVHVAGMDHETQERQIRAALAEPAARRPTALLVCPVRESSLRLLAREAAQLGVAWVSLNRWSDYLLTLREQFPRVPIFSVTPDQRQIGQIQAQHFKLLAPRAGEIVYIRGPLGTSSAQRRFDAVQEQLALEPFNVVAINSDWSFPGGERAMNEWLQIFQRRALPPFMVGAQNDTMALGARAALELWAREAGRALPQVRFTGCDGLPTQGQRHVSEGTLAATVVVPSVAARAVEELAEAARTQRVPPSEVSLPVSSYPELATLARTQRALVR